MYVVDLRFGGSRPPTLGVALAWGAAFAAGFLLLGWWRYGVAPSPWWAALYVVTAMLGSTLLWSAFVRD